MSPSRSPADAVPGASPPALSRPLSPAPQTPAPPTPAPVASAVPGPFAQPADGAPTSESGGLPPWALPALLLAAVPALLLGRRAWLPGAATLEPAVTLVEAHAPSGATPLLPAVRSGNSAFVRAQSVGFAAQPTVALQPVLPERFTDVQFLAQGGMGVVYQARDSLLDRRVAVKTLAPNLAANAEFLERFFRESRAMARLSHPTIVAVHDVARTPFPYIVMEFLEGETVRKLVAEGKLSYRQRIAVGLDVARALAYAHAAGVIHRDIKTDNVMVTGDGRTKLLDFGLARLENPDPAAPQLTQPNMVMGTPNYMAPELLDGSPATPRTDIFALGKVLNQLCEAPEQATGAPSRGRALERAIAHMIHFDPERRVGDVNECVQALEEELARLAAPAGSVSLASFRAQHRALEQAYSRTLHGLKASLGVYRRCEDDVASVFEFLLNPEGVAEVSASVDALIAGPLAALSTRPASGVARLDQLAGELSAFDWAGLKRELAELAGVAPEARRQAVERLRVLHLSVADLAGRLATALSAHRARLAPSVEAAVKGVAGHERVALSLDSDPPLTVPAPDTLAADVRELVANLVNNALEAQAQHVAVSLSEQPDSVQLRVSDDGVGIPAELLPALFESGQTTKTTGSGTGLARVKHLAGQYGGTARATSQPGAGSTFTVTFPA